MGRSLYPVEVGNQFHINVQIVALFGKIIRNNLFKKKF